MPFSKARNIFSNLRGKSPHKEEAAAVTEIGLDNFSRFFQRYKISANDSEEKPEPESQPNPENSELEHPETTVIPKPLTPL